MSTTDAAPFAVVGLGNPLMGDDGVGLRALHQLDAGWTFDDSMQLVDGGTWGLTLLPALERRTGVIFLDAVRCGRAPGTVVELRDDEVPRQIETKLSTHQVDLRELLAIMELRGTLPTRVSVIGVEPSFVEMSDALSPTVASRTADIVALAIRRLRSWGVSCSQRTEAAHACTK